MKKNFLENIYSSHHIVIFVLYISLIIGFAFNENSTGGAYIDYLGQKQISISFSNSFLETLLNFEQEQTRHSPILIMLFSYFEKIELDDLFIRLINLHICLFLPIFFYKCLKLKFADIENKYLILFSSLIFLSPTFRSLAIWPDSRLWGLTFFVISIYYFLSYKNDKDFKNCLLTVLFYSIGSYFSPNFSVLSVFFILYFLRELSLIKNLQFLTLNLLLALPAFYYVFILDVNFMFSASAVPGGEENTLLALNISNKILIISSLIFFYLLPFIFSKSIDLNLTLEKTQLKYSFIAIIAFIVCIFFFNYQIDYTGGGIFFKISNLLFKNNILFFFISAISIFIIYKIFFNSNINFLIILLLLLNNPQLTIYHKYYDPFLLILFFTLFEIKFKKEKLFSKKTINIFYLFSLFFLTLSISKAYV